MILRFVCMQIIQLEFLDFYTEECCDKVEVYDGSSSSATLVGTFSGYNSPGDIFFDSPLFIRFHTDVSMTMGGFNITYSISEHKTGSV